MEEVRRYSGSSVLLALVGNKADLENLREVEFEEAEAICQYMPEVLFVLEASAKENSNIEEAFMCLATELKVYKFKLYYLFILTCCFLFIQQRRHDNGSLQTDDEDIVHLGESRSVSRCNSCIRQNIF